MYFGCVKPQAPVKPMTLLMIPHKTNSVFLNGRLDFLQPSKKKYEDEARSESQVSILSEREQKALAYRGQNQIYTTCNYHNPVDGPLRSKARDPESLGSPNILKQGARSNPTHPGMFQNGDNHPVGVQSRSTRGWQDMIHLMTEVPNTPYSAQILEPCEAHASNECTSQGSSQSFREDKSRIHSTRINRDILCCTGINLSLNCEGQNPISSRRWSSEHRSIRDKSTFL